MIASTPPCRPISSLLAPACSDLNLYPAAEWKGKYEICDSEDPARELEGWSYSDVPCPEKGEKGWVGAGAAQSGAGKCWTKEDRVCYSKIGRRGAE